MHRADTVKTAENLRVAYKLAKAGIDFVCIPVHGAVSREILSTLLEQQLAAIEKEISNEGEN